MRSFENIDKYNDVWPENDVCELGFQHITDTDIPNASAKQKGERSGWGG
jgi:hypothetical protein